MPRPSMAQWKRIIDVRNTIDYYLPEHKGPGVDTDARILLSLAESHIMEDNERDALVRFIDEWARKVAHQIEVDRAWNALYEAEEAQR